MNEANEIVLRLQARGDHSEAEIRAQLEHRGFSRMEIEAAIQWGQDHAALSDTRAAESTVHRELEKKRGALRIQAKLEQRGLDPEGFSSTSADELSRAKAALLPRVTKYRDEPMKALGWLSRQGFEEEVAFAAVEALIGLPEEPPER